MSWLIYSLFIEWSLWHLQLLSFHLHTQQFICDLNLRVQCFLLPCNTERFNCPFHSLCCSPIPSILKQAFYYVFHFLLFPVHSMFSCMSQACLLLCPCISSLSLHICFPDCCTLFGCPIYVLCYLLGCFRQHFLAPPLLSGLGLYVSHLWEAMRRTLALWQVISIRTSSWCIPQGNGHPDW